VAIGVVRAASAEVPYRRDSAITGALSAQLEQSLDPAATYQINEFDPVALGSPAFGLALELERHDFRAGVGPWGESGVMPFRVVTDDHATATLWYVATSPVITAFASLPGAVVRARYDVRTGDEAKRADQLEEQLVQTLCSTGRPELAGLPWARWGDTAIALASGLSPEVEPILKRYTDLRQPAAVIELPVGVNGYEVTAKPPRTCAG
jgi:hypothetical protein